MTFKTVEQMEAEIKKLKGENSKAFVAGMLAERGLIVEWLRRLNDWQEDCLANDIEAGEHLK